jgi:LPXTG-motif cell wall-anchored protein
VENPATPGDDCSVPPPGGCVENPLTPGPDCDSSTPPSTGCCTLVSPPSAAAPPAGSTLVPSVGRPGRTQAGVLPATGAPANVAALLLASGLLLSGGVLVLRRTRPAR